MYSYLVSLEIVVGYKKVRSFQETQVNLSVLLEKPDITYRRTLDTESLGASCRISPRPRAILKIHYFSGGQQVFQISPGIKSLNDRVKNLFIYWPGRHNLGPGGQFQQIYWTVKPPGHLKPVIIIGNCVYFLKLLSNILFLLKSVQISNGIHNSYLQYMW